MSVLGMLGIGAASAAIDQGLGMINQNSQMEKNKEIADYNQKLNKEMFDHTYNKTNTTAQMAQLKKNGLNPTLMYSGGGSQQLQTSAIGGNSDGVGMIKNDGFAKNMEISLLQAQKENIEADTKNKEADAENKGADTQTKIASLSEIAARTNESVAKRELLGIEADVNRGRIKIAMEDLRRLQRENAIGEETYNSAVMAIRWQAAGEELNNELKQANIDLNEAQRESIQQGILQAWQKVAVEWKNADSNRKQAIVSEILAELKKDRPTLEEIKGANARKLQNIIINVGDNMDKKFGTDIPGMSEATKLK